MSAANIRLIDAALLEAVAEAAKAAPRGRKNYNFHPNDGFPAHRLLNAVEPWSYIPPHRHASPEKGETMVVLRGKLGLVELDEDGAVLRATVLASGGETIGCDIPHGTFHTVLALEPGTVFLEAKAGPYQALGEHEIAAWAPREGAPEVPAYMAGLRALFEPVPDHQG